MAAHRAPRPVVQHLDDAFTGGPWQRAQAVAAQVGLRLLVIIDGQLEFEAQTGERIGGIQCPGPGERAVHRIEAR